MLDPQTSLNLNQVQVIVQGMYAIAKCDEVHQTELVLLREFYENCRQDSQGLSDFDDLIHQDLDSQRAVHILDNEELRITFLRSCIFLAYADGSYSDKERQCVAQFAKDLQVDAETLAILEQQVGDTLMQNIARIQNVEALKEVAAEL